MSAIILLLMTWKYPLAESQKWREHVSNDCPSYEMEIRTTCESKWREHVTRNCATYEMEIRTGWESKVAGTCQQWLCCLWNGNTHRLKVESGGNISAMKVGTCQQWLCCLWNGNTHILIKSDGNKLATIVLLMKWKYAHPNRKWRVHVSHDCTAYELETRTGCELKVAEICQQWLLFMKWKYALPDTSVKCNFYFKLLFLLFLLLYFVK